MRRLRLASWALLSVVFELVHVTTLIEYISHITRHVETIPCKARTSVHQKPVQDR